MPNREQRRRRARQGRPVLIVGDGIAAAELPGHRYEARPHAELPAKIPGHHRWVAVGSWVLTQDAVASAQDPDVLKLLDHENLMALSIGCWDCEQPLGAIVIASRCPGDPSS
jgi:hypothetical protein